MSEKLGTVGGADFADRVRGVGVVEDRNGSRRTTRGRDGDGAGFDLGLVSVDDGSRFQVGEVKCTSARKAALIEGGGGATA